MAVEVRFHLAGLLRIEAGEAVFNGEGLGRNGRLTLAYLLHHRSRPVNRDEIAELLWGEELPRSWDQLVRGVVAKLRVALGSVGLDPRESLATVFGGYQLRLPLGSVVDVEEAVARLAAAEEALTYGEAERARKEAAEVVEVAGAGFLPGGSGRWVESRQAELVELRLRALETLSKAAVATGDATAALVAAEQALELQPYRESAHLRLIAAHAAAGDRTAALRAYERCRRMLVEELGVLPSAATQNAYAALLVEDRPPAPVAPRPPARLPVPASLAVAASAGVCVGRKTELSRLRNAVEDGTGLRAVLVAGEPGAGKTRLAAELAVSAHAGGARVLYGRCDEGLDVAYQPFVEALSHYVAHAPVEELTAHVARHGGDVARVVPELARRLPATPAAPPVESAADRYQLFAAVGDLIAGAARATSLVLVLDDLHWASEPALMLLAHVLRAAGDSRLLIVGTYRDNEPAPLLCDLYREPGVERMALGGLDEAAVAAYVAAQAPADLGRAAGELAHVVHARTQGNAFFVAELVRHVAEGDPEGRILAVPEVVREVVRARLGRLSPAAQAALPLAAVVGAEFSLDVVQRLGAADPDALLDALEEAAAARLVVERPDSAGRYGFAHAIVRDTLYSGLSAARRSRLHRSVGEALESLGTDGGAQLLPALAHHFREAAGAGCAAKAADYSLLAARQAMEQAAWEEAASQLEAGLRTLDGKLEDNRDNRERRYDLLLELAGARGPLGVIPEIRSAALAAAEEARRLGSAPQVAQAILAALGTPILEDDVLRRCVELAEEAITALGEEEVGLRARLLARLALPSLGFVREADADRALDLARECEDPDVLFFVLTMSSMLFTGSDDLPKGLRLAEEALALAKERPGTIDRTVPGLAAAESRPEYMALRFRAIARLALCDREGFEADMAAVHDASERRRFTVGKCQSRVWRTACDLADGRFEEARAGLDWWRWRKSPVWGNIGFEFQFAQLGLEKGCLHEVLSRMLPVENAPWDRTYRAVLARSYVELKDERAARQQMDAVAAVGFDGLPDRAMTFACLAEAACRLGDVAWAELLLPLLRRHAGRLVVARFGSVVPGAVDRYLAMLAATLGEFDEADERFRAAAELEERALAPPLAARTRYWHAEMLTRRGAAGKRAEAADLLDLVLATTTRLGMEPLRQQSEALRSTM